MAKQFRVIDQLMMSLGDKEATYDAGPAAWTLGAAFQMFEFSQAFVAWEDMIVSDEKTVHGSQYPTVDEIVKQDARFVYSEPRVRPYTLGGLAALAGGVVSVQQDGALVAYRHKITPVAAGTDLPSIGIQEKSSAEQYMYYGVKCDTLKLARGGPGNGYFALEAGLIGSGTRAVSATAFPAKVTLGTPLRWGDGKCFIETGANISIDATPTQGLENISSATPDVLSTRILDFRMNHGNGLQADDGYTPTSGKVRGRLDHGENRATTIEIPLLVDPATLATERGYYDNRDNVAVELDVNSGVLIAAGGAMYFGLDLIIPRLRLDPIEREVQEGANVMTLKGKCFDDGTNPPWILYVYSSQAVFLA